MEIKKIKESLCLGDERNPNHETQTIINSVCQCNNCRFGLSDLAYTLLEKYDKETLVVTEPIPTPYFSPSTIEQKFLVMNLVTKYYLQKDNSFGKFIHKAKKFDTTDEIHEYISNGELREVFSNSKITIVGYLKIKE